MRSRVALHRSSFAPCTGAAEDVNVPNTDALRATIYRSLRATAAQASSTWTSNRTIGNIGVDDAFTWNRWDKLRYRARAPLCAKSPLGCAGIYTQFMLVFNEAQCWPKSQGVPILANAFTTPVQLRQCTLVLHHLLAAKPCGSYVTGPYEQRDAFLMRAPIVTCGNNPRANVTGNEEDSDHEAGHRRTESTRHVNRGYPVLDFDAEGGGGTWLRPWTFAETRGMCNLDSVTRSSTEPLDAAFAPNGERFGGTVQTEEFGHTIFDVAIPQFDPLGWRAVQYAAHRATVSVPPLRTLDPSWDCHTSTTEYFAAGVELLLYGTRIGTNHKARTRSELARIDPDLFCLAARYYERTNTWRPCARVPNSAHAPNEAERRAEPSELSCIARLRRLEPDIPLSPRSNGAMCVNPCKSTRKNMPFVVQLCFLLFSVTVFGLLVFIPCLRSYWVKKPESVIYKLLSNKTDLTDPTDLTNPANPANPANPTNQNSEKGSTDVNGSHILLRL